MKHNLHSGNRKLVTSKSVFNATIVVTTLTILIIWLSGIGQHRTLFVNSLLSTSILSAVSFLFLTIGLYRGIKLKDNLGKITDGIKMEMPDLAGSADLSLDPPDLGEGIAGVILGIIAWILFSVLLLFLIWLFSTIVWAMVLVFAAMLYWIFFRALRLVLKNSNRCRGNLVKSMAYAAGYTVLYNFWIYGIILASHYFIR